MITSTLDTLTLIVAMSVMFTTVSLWAFTDFIMRGLGRASALAAVHAMQNINKTVLRSAFIVLFVLNNFLLLFVTGVAWMSKENIILPVAALCLYFCGVFLLTGTRNVPLNERLRKTTVTTEAEARAAWGWYAPAWTQWNTIRCLCGFGVVVLLLVTLYV